LKKKPKKPSKKLETAQAKVSPAIAQLDEGDAQAAVSPATAQLDESMERAKAGTAATTSNATPTTDVINNTLSLI